MVHPTPPGLVWDAGPAPQSFSIQQVTCLACPFCPFKCYGDSAHIRALTEKAGHQTEAAKKTQHARTVVGEEFRTRAGGGAARRKAGWKVARRGWACWCP